jgi:hypothetical protein
MGDSPPGVGYEVATIISKIIIVTALAYLIFVVAFCPCFPLIRCHLLYFWIAILVVISIALFWTLW